MQRQYQAVALILFVLVVGTAYFSTKKNQEAELQPHIASETLAGMYGPCFYCYK